MKHSKTLFTLALTTISFTSVCEVSASDQTAAAAAAPAKTKTQTQTQTVSKEFLAFWETFKDALQKNDKNALADMTKLPFMDMDKKLDRAQFIEKCETIFTASNRKTLLSEKPMPEKDQVFLFCGDSVFVFAKVQGKYKFIDINPND